MTAFAADPAPEPAPPLDGRGGCLCGAVRFETSALDPHVTLCHCSMCRKFHGHAGPYTTAPLNRFTLLDSQGALRWYRSSAEAERGFCGLCGSSLFFRWINGTRMEIAAGSLDGLTGLRMVKHIYVASKGDYYEIDDSLPQIAQGSEQDGPGQDGPGQDGPGQDSAGQNAA